MKGHFQLGELRQLILRSVYRRMRSFEGRTPAVSFCFDDFPRSAYSVGGSILKSFGARGTYYASLGLMDTSNTLGDQLTRADLEAVVSDDHELGSHTYNHCSVREVSLDQFEKDVFHGRDAIRNMVSSDAGNFAYPYGHVSVKSKKRLGAQLSSCRGVYGGINGPLVDLNLLRANSLYGDTDRLAEAESLLAENNRRLGWLIFYTHDVRQNPSPFGCTPALLDKVIERTLEKGFRIVPIGKIVSEDLEPALAAGTTRNTSAA
jgi:peptidoglycan/xylan/chitin deacetylase (PgdA/CDA1 family)